MLKDIIEARVIGGQIIYLRFGDGVEGEVDLNKVLGEFKGVFAPLRDPAEVLRLRVDPEKGTICWPNGADLDPDVLYEEITGQQIDFRASEEDVP